MTVIAAMLLGIGFVLQQHAAAKLPSSYLHLKLIGQLARQRIWVGGVAIMVVGQGLSAWGLGHLSLTVSEPLLTTSLIFALLFAAPIYGEVPRKTELAGALLLSAGVAALSASRSVRALSESFGSASHWPAAALIAVVAAALVIAGRNGPANLRAMLTGAGGGLVLGIADALTRRSVEIIDGHGLSALLTTWPGYAVICTAAVGLWLTQNAFSAGPLHASLPGITGAEPLAGITLGILVFGDIVHVTPWLIALQAAGLAAMVSGVIMVARAPVFGNLHLRQVAAAAHSEAAKLAVPKVTVPKVTVPKVTVPKVTVPKVTVPKVSVPSVTIPDLPVLSTPEAAIQAARRLRAPWLRLARLKISRLWMPKARPESPK